MRIKELNREFNTQQNFMYGMMLLAWRHSSHRLADISGLQHMSPEDLTQGVMHLCDCMEIITGIESLVLDGVRMNSLRTYMVTLKSSVKSEEARRVLKDFRNYLESTTGVSTEQAAQITRSLLTMITLGVLEEYTTLSHAGNAFHKVHGVRLRKK